MQTGRSFFLCLVLALIASFALTSKPAAPELQTTLLQTTLKRILPPPLADALSRQPASLQAQFIDYAAHPVLLARAQLALRVHTQIAPEIFIHHGADPAFQDVLKKYGEGVLLPIQYFRNHDLRPLYWMLHAPAKAHAAFDQLYGEPTPPPADEAADANTLKNTSSSSRHETRNDRADEDGDDDNTPQTPPEPPFSLDDPLPAGARWGADVRGRLAIYFMQDEGYAFLSRFQAGDPAKKRIDQTQISQILASIGLPPAASDKALPDSASATGAVAPITDYSLANLSTIGAVRALAIDASAPPPVVADSAAAADSSGEEADTDADTNTAADTAAPAQSQSVLQMYINRYLALAGPLLHTLPLAESSPKLALFCLPLRYPQLLDSTLSSLAQTFNLPLPALRFGGWLLLFFILAWFGRYLITPLLALLSLVSATLQGLRSWLRPQRNWH